MTKEYKPAQTFIDSERKWDERFKSPENWTGDPAATLSTEAVVDIDKSMEFLGDVVTSMNEGEARKVADFYAKKLEDLTKAFASRLKGEKALAMLRAYFMGPVFGFNIYAEGTSGVGKTWTMNQLSKLMDMPFADLHARSDTSDAEIVGEERLVPTASGKNRIAFAHGVVTKPGACGVLIDEFPRLPARSSNSCLQAMEDKKVRVPLNSLFKPDHQTNLSRHFCFIACGNPASYVGQGDRNRALFDRFAIGVEVVRPDDQKTLDMYLAKDNPIDLPDDFQRFGQNTFRKVKAATWFAEFANEGGYKPFDATKPLDQKNQFVQLMAASAAVSPADYLRRTGWVDAGTARGEDQLTPALEAYQKAFKGDSEKRDQFAKLREQVNENVVEGSNPRGELLVLEVARALRVLDDEGDGHTRFVVKPTHMQQAFIMANLVRLKPYPGCEDAIRPIIESAANLFFT